MIEYKRAGTGQVLKVEKHKTLSRRTNLLRAKTRDKHTLNRHSWQELLNAEREWTRFGGRIQKEIRFKDRLLNT